MLFPLRFISTSLKQLSLDDIIMVADPPPPPPPPNFRGYLKISDQNNWGGGDLSKKLNVGGELNLRGDLKF